MTHKNAEELHLQIQYALMERLSVSQNRQARLLELLDECIFECDKNLNFTYVNPAWESQLGYSKTTMLETSLLNLLKKDGSNTNVQAVSEWVKTLDNNLCEEVLIPSNNGKSYWFELRLNRCLADGTSLTGMLINIHHRKQLENRLRQREEEARRLSLVATHTNNLVIITDRNGLIVWVNNSFELESGYKRSEVIGQKPSALLQGPLSDKTKIKAMGDAIRAGRAFSLEIINYHKNGTPYWVSIDASPVFDNNELTHFIAIESNITQRVLAEKAASESEFNYRTVVDNIHEVVLRLQPNGELLFANHAWEKLIGEPEQSCIGRNINQYVCEDYIEWVNNTLKKYEASNTDSCRLDIQINTHQGEPCWVEMTMTPILDPTNNQLISVAATLVNVNERVAAAVALKDAKQYAEALAETKSRFLANVSHEIRTPLNAVLGAADLITDTGLTREQLRYSDMIMTSGKALLGVLDDVLTYSRFDAGAITIEKHEFDIIECFEEAIDIVAQSAIEKGLKLVLDIHPDIPRFVIADKTRIRQILINLLSNAIKFTSRGHVTFTAKATINNASQAQFELCVSDSGIGIDAKMLDQLFDPFVQGDVSTTRQYGGSGLGLAICKQICEAHNGYISASSTLNQGSQFTVNINIDVVEAEHSSTNSQANPNSPVWIVGDNTSLIVALENTLKHLELQFRTIPSYSHAPENEEPLAIMSTYDDIDQSAQYQSPFISNNQTVPPPYVLTFDLSGKGKNIELKSAYHMHINGPYKPSDLSYALESMEDIADTIHTLPQPKQKGKQGNRLPDLQGKLILVVEDVEANQELVSQYLRDRGCEVNIAVNGKEALNQLSSSHPDLILMDIQMPVMDGLTATRFIRADLPEHNNTPIIAVTADAVHGDREQCLEVGMNDYLSKPLFRDALNVMLDKYLLPQSSGHSVVNKMDRLRHSFEQFESYSRLAHS